jgi:hypothetical protein
MHQAELKVNLFLQEALAGRATVTEEVADKVASDVKAAVLKQFSGPPRDAFRLRMSNIGKPTCQLWHQKNKAESKAPYAPHFLINMIIGDIVEAVFKGLLTASGIVFGDNDTVSLDLGELGKINGEYDMILDGAVDDVKSASNYSFNTRFASFEKLIEKDTFGYIPQLVGYGVAANKKIGGFWVINKENGSFKYVSVNAVDKESVLEEIKETVSYIQEDKPFERCFEPVPEYYSRKPSGNMILGETCRWCNFKSVCWEDLQTLPSRVSKARILPMVDYISINDNEEEVI